MSDQYPESLNPFAEDLKPRMKKVSMKESFRKLSRNLRESFRAKKNRNEDIFIRHEARQIPPRSVSFSYQGEALPRSRFQERIRQSSNATENHFENEGHQSDNYFMPIRRRIKKPAPLPPKSSSEQNLNDDNSNSSLCDSHWSLSTNIETCPITDDFKNNGVEKESILTELVTFNENMKTINGETETQVEENCVADTIHCNENEGDAENSTITSTEELKNDQIAGCPNVELIEETDGKKESNLNDDIDQKEIDNDESGLPFRSSYVLFIDENEEERNDKNLIDNEVLLNGLTTEACNDFSEHDANSNTDRPVLKQRKHKLNRQTLLGVKPVNI